MVVEDDAQKKAITRVLEDDHQKPLFLTRFSMMLGGGPPPIEPSQALGLRVFLKMIRIYGFLGMEPRGVPPPLAMPTFGEGPPPHRICVQHAVIRMASPKLK